MFWYLLEMGRQTLFRGAIILQYCKGRKIEPNSEYKWEFLAKEQGEGQWMEND